MSWLIGIVCVILVLIFWRIFLPLGVLAAILIGVVILVMQYNEKQKAEDNEKAAAQLRQKIALARATATSEGKRWKLSYQPDPASDVLMARTAYIESNDTLCRLSVQKRISGAQLTGLDCSDFKISEWEDIEVKFSNVETSKKMNLESYSDSDRMYIPSNQSDYSGHLKYATFINGLKNRQSVAIKIPSAGGFWTTFSLAGSSDALNKLGSAKQISKQ